MTSADERAIAVELYNSTWTLLEQESRTPDEDDRILHMAHASRFHWDNAGNDQNRATSIRCPCREGGGRRP